MTDERAERLAKLVKASGQVSKAELPTPAMANLKKKFDAGHPGVQVQAVGLG